MEKKLRVKVIKTNTYIVKIDETIWTPDAIKKWGKPLWGAETAADLARDLAESLMRYDSDTLMEGFGYVRKFANDGRQLPQYKYENRKWVPVPDEEYTLGLSYEIECDDDVESEVKLQQ